MTAFALFQALLTAVTLGAVIWAAMRVNEMLKRQENLPETVTAILERKHLEMLKDLNDGLNTLADRLSSSTTDNSERLRGTLSQDLKQTRDAMLVLQLSQTEELSTHRDTMSQRLMGLTAELQMKFDELRGETSQRLMGLTGDLQAKFDELRGETTVRLMGLTGDVQTKLDETRNESSQRLLGLTTDMQSKLDESRNESSQRLMTLTADLQTKNDELRGDLSHRLMTLTSDVQQKNDELRAELLSRVLERLGEQGRANQEVIQTTLQGITELMNTTLQSITAQLTSSIDGLTRTTDARLEQISGKVGERLEEGFKKTNETFANVMARLATIDEAQRKIDGLTTNVVSLQELLGDKRSRGAFGEVQLEALVRNLLPPSAYEFQYTLPNGCRADCMLLLPEPTGFVAVDAKFPLENYHRMYEGGESERAAASRQFRLDLRKHVNDIAERYIMAGETSDGAVMFVPAESVFAEIHARHSEVVEHAMQRHVWIVSPTTMMAVLNTARAVIKDVETRRQVHIIKDELSKLGKEFGRFDQRMRKLAEHIRMAHQDAEEVRITSDKISRRFMQIERVEFDGPAPLPAPHELVGALEAIGASAADEADAAHDYPVDQPQAFDVDESPEVVEHAPMPAQQSG